MNMQRSAKELLTSYLQYVKLLYLSPTIRGKVMIHVLTANDECTSGSLCVTWDDGKGDTAPLRLSFARYTDGNKYPTNNCEFTMSRYQAKKLAKIIIENL